MDSHGGRFWYGPRFSALTNGIVREFEEDDRRKKGKVAATLIGRKRPSIETKIDRCLLSMLTLDTSLRTCERTYSHIRHILANNLIVPAKKTSWPLVSFAAIYHVTLDQYKTVEDESHAHSARIQSASLYWKHSLTFAGCLPSVKRDASEHLLTSYFCWQFWRNVK